MSRRAAPGIRAAIAEACRGRLIGVEREYEVIGTDGPTDARALWPGLPDPGVHLDPGARWPAVNAAAASSPRTVGTPSRQCPPY